MFINGYRGREGGREGDCCSFSLCVCVCVPLLLHPQSLSVLVNSRIKAALSAFIFLLFHNS